MPTALTDLKYSNRSPVGPPRRRRQPDPRCLMDYQIQVITVPVTDVDLGMAFYAKQAARSAASSTVWPATTSRQHSSVDSGAIERGRKSK